MACEGIHCRTAPSPGARQAPGPPAGLAVTHPGLLAIVLSSILILTLIVAPGIAAAVGPAMAPPGAAPVVLAPDAPPPIERLTRQSPAAPQAGPMRPAEPGRVARTAPASPTLPPAMRAPPARELAQLRRAAQARGGFGSTRASANAAWTLGLVHLHGAGVPRSPALAQAWFKRAASHGLQPLAQAGLAWCLIDGCQSPPDPAGARQAIEALRARQPARALYLQWWLDTRLQPLGSVADAGGVFPLPASPAQALPMEALLRRAAAAGDAQARVELGIAAVNAADLPAARRHFRAAASRSPAAAANLRQLAATTAQPPGADAQALRLLAQARRVHRGDGLPANYVEAVRLYQLAADRGSQPARRMLALIAARRAPDGSIDIGWMAQLARLDTASNLPQLDAGLAAPLMQRDATPVYDLMPAAWQRRAGVRFAG